MKYVEEYRDADKVHQVLAEIRARLEHRTARTAWFHLSDRRCDRAPKPRSICPSIDRYRGTPRSGEPANHHCQCTQPGQFDLYTCSPSLSGTTHAGAYSRPGFWFYVCHLDAFGWQYLTCPANNGVPSDTGHFGRILDLIFPTLQSSLRTSIRQQVLPW